jgi:predicted P-loop ATPase
VWTRTSEGERERDEGKETTDMSLRTSAVFEAMTRRWPTGQSKRTRGVDPEGRENETTKAIITRDTSVSK